MAIKVYKKFRLIEQSNKEFKINEHRKELRSVKIDEVVAENYNKQAKASGIYYEIDKKATKERDEIIIGKTEPDEKEQLQARATELGVDFDGRTGIDKLKELIAIAEKED